MSLTIDGHRIDVLFSESEIKSRINVLAGEIAARQPHRLLVVPVLKGSFIFAADLIREAANAACQIHLTVAYPQVGDFPSPGNTRVT